MTSLITCVLSASVLVSDAVWPSRSFTVGPSPWNTWMISPASWLTSCGLNAWNSGWKPLNSAVRSSAGRVWCTSMVAPAGSGSTMDPVPWSSAT